MTEFVDDWLAQAGREAHNISRQIALGGGFLESADADEFAREVHHRLSIGAREYGDSFKHRPLEEIEAEVLQEPPDIAAWSFLYGLRRGLDAHGCQLHLLRAAALAAMAQAELRRAIDSPPIED